MSERTIKINVNVGNFADLKPEEFDRLRQLVTEEVRGQTGLRGCAKIFNTLIHPEREIKAYQERIAEITRIVGLPDPELTQRALQGGRMTGLLSGSAYAAVMNLNRSYIREREGSSNKVPDNQNALDKTFRLTKLAAVSVFLDRTK